MKFTLASVGPLIGAFLATHKPKHPRLRQPDIPDGPLSRLLYRYLVHPEKLWEDVKRVVGEWLQDIAPLSLGVVVALLAVWVGLRLLRGLRDRQLSRGGRRLQILPPSDASPGAAEVLWAGLHGLIPPAWKRLLLGEPALFWEVVSSADGLVFSIWVPDAVPASYVEQAVETAWPGCSVREIPPSPPLPPGPGHVTTAEMALARPQWFPIGSGPDADPLRLVLAAMGTAEEGEGSALQVMARPAPSSRGGKLAQGYWAARAGLPNFLAWRVRRRLPSLAPRDPITESDTRLVQTKTNAPLWECRIRIAVFAPTRGRARARIHSLATAFSMYEGPNGLRRRRAPRGRRAIAARRLRRGFLLSVQELASIATLPGSGSLPGLDLAESRILAPPRSLPIDGRVLGRTASGTAARPVAISLADARHHLHVIGETGTGKSTLLAHLALQDAATGRAAVVIDPKGDLVEAILEQLPSGAEGRTCLIDPDDKEAAVGLNVLAGRDSDLVGDHVASLFNRIYERHWGPRSDDILRAACQTLTRIPGATLAEVPLLLTSAEWRRAIRDRLQHPILRMFWTQFDKKNELQRQGDISPLMNKLRAFLLRGAIMTIVGQARPKIDVSEFLEAGGLLLVRIPKGTLGEDTSRLLGSMVMTRVWQAAMARAHQPEEGRKDVALYVDEVHNYLVLPRSFEDLLAEARGYRLSLVLVHQHLGQLNREMRDALEANARTKVVFACSPKDAEAFKPHFAPYLTDHDLSHLPAFTAACRPCLEGTNGRPFTFRTEPLPPGSANRAREVRQRSADLFALPRHQVQALINHRHVKPERRLLPRPGNEQWGGQSFGESPGRSRGHLRLIDGEGPETEGEED